MGINEATDGLRIASVYPNPITSEVNIDIELERSADVQILLRDLLGGEIAVLVNEKMNAGKHTISESLAAYNISGMFFMDLMFNGRKVETKKLIAVNHN